MLEHMLKFFFIRFTSFVITTQAQNNDMSEKKKSKKKIHLSPLPLSKENLRRRICHKIIHQNNLTPSTNFISYVQSMYANIILIPTAAKNRPRQACLLPWMNGKNWALVVIIWNFLLCSPSSFARSFILRSRKPSNLREFSLQMDRIGYHVQINEIRLFAQIGRSLRLKIEVVVPDCTL